MTDEELKEIEERVRYHARNVTDEDRWTRTGTGLVYGDIPRLIARIRELENSQRWQPIETAPRDGRWFEAAPHIGSSPEVMPARWALFGARNGYWEWLRPSRVACAPTHWRPLPEAPK